MSTLGTVAQVIGPVVDVDFPPGQLPALMTALSVSNPSISNTPDNLVLEVAHATYSASHLTARCASKAFSAGLAHRLVLHLAHGDPRLLLRCRYPFPSAGASQEVFGSIGKIGCGKCLYGRRASTGVASPAASTSKICASS